MTDQREVAEAPAAKAGGGLVVSSEDHGGYSITPITGTLSPPDHGSRELLFPGISAAVTPIDPTAAAALPADRNPYLAYRRSLGNDESRRTMAACLDRIVAILTDQTDLPPEAGALFPWHLLRFQHTTAIRSGIVDQPWAPSYSNKHLAALRRVLRYSWKLGLMTADEYQAATDLERIPGRRLPAGRSVAAKELEAILRVCVDDPRPIGRRDAAVLAALYSSGCRRSELAGAHRDDYDIGRRALRIIGKGDKQREVYFTEDAAAHVGRWLTFDTRRSGPLFGRLHRTGKILPGHLTGESVGKIVQGRAKEAGVPAPTAHDFRRTFIGDVLDSGTDLATAQGLVGHASPVTTAAYDRRPARTRQEAVDRLRVPGPDELARPGG